MLSIENIGLVQSELGIVWSDGKESYIPIETLRRACPCATCQGEPDATGRVVRPKVSYNDRSFTLRSYQPVGGYALLIRFEDGHGTGIYSYKYLRNLSGLRDSGKE